MTRFLLVLSLMTLMQASFFAQLQLQVVKVPNNTPINEPLYVAGNFNNWNPGDQNYQLTKDQAGIYHISIDPSAGLLEFKFTRGDWQRVEGDANGASRPNRSYQYDGNATTLTLEILSWEGSNTGGSTAAANVSILDNAFYLPQLNRQRRIWLYLPPDYNSSNKRYPVLYMHDGQNLFDQTTSFSGEWKVDETLNTLHEQGDHGIIVVGIDNGGADRLDEYTPWSHPTYGGGNGDNYIDFIVETLKPYIDENYRTYPQPEFTGLMGSSLGGLISTYGIIEHQDVFGKAGCFSSSYWLYDNPYEHVRTTGRQADLKVYLIAGGQESSDVDVVADMYRMEQTMENVGFSATRIKALDHPDGMHSEWYWAREFAEAYLWLFGNLNFPTALKGVEINYEIAIHPNPGRERLIVQLENPLQQGRLELYNVQGIQVRSYALGDLQNEFLVEQLPAGMYTIRIVEKGQVVFSEQWMKVGDNN